MPQDEAGQDSKVKSKTEHTLARLTQLLEATPAAEELSRTWRRSKDETLQRDGPRLQDLSRALNAGKVLKQGVPMWIVVRMCKASWHQDGTWPLLGADEDLPSALHSMEVARSTHPSAQLLRPEGITGFQVPAEEADTDTRHRQEPTADEIAASYRERGSIVEDATHIQQDW